MNIKIICLLFLFFTCDAKVSAQGNLQELGRVDVVNIVEWDGSAFSKVYERSNQLPVSIEEIIALRNSGFNDSSIVKIIEQRRCVCDASVDALVGLKRLGFSENLLAAISLHALPPNRAINLTVQFDFSGPKTGEIAVQNKKIYLYVIILDGEKERIFIGDMHEIINGRWRIDTLYDETITLLPKKLRRVVFAAEVPLKTYGKRSVFVFTSTRPDIYKIDDVPKGETVKKYVIDYPVSSIENICKLKVRYDQDAILKERWHWRGSDFNCEWN